MQPQPKPEKKIPATICGFLGEEAGHYA